MSQPGYHPTCVLFQGNDCAFDGTYRLVCRHQIRPKDFQPGDNVEVDMRYDDDDNCQDAKEQDEDSTNRSEGRRWRDAIALGDQMVMSLLRNMCKTQPAGKTPWSSNSNQGKRKEDRDETDVQVIRTKQVKTEECTTSQEANDRVESLQNILSAVHSVQAAQDHVASELSSIRHCQQLLSNQVATMQKALNRLEDTGKLCDVASPHSEMEQAPTPVSLFLSPSQTLGSNITSSGQRVSNSAAQASSIPLSSPGSSFSEIIISNLRSHAHPDLPAFQNQDSQDLSALPPLYPIEDMPESYPQVPYNFHFTDKDQTKVFLGYQDSPVTLFKHEIEAILSKTNTPPAFAYRLAGKIFTNEELFHGNTAGKGQMRDGTPFKQLNPQYLGVILMEVAARFPTFNDVPGSTKKLHTAINERCRNERKKLSYHYGNKTNPGAAI